MSSTAEDTPSRARECIPTHPVGHRGPQQCWRRATPAEHRSGGGGQGQRGDLLVGVVGMLEDTGNVSARGAPVSVENIGVPTNALLPATGALVPTRLGPTCCFSGDPPTRALAPRGRGFPLDFQGADFPSTLSEII